MTARTISDARVSRREWSAVVLAVLIAHAFYWRIVLYPSDFDAQNYLDIATDILRNGLFSKFYYSNVRTYGYPLFLAALRRCASASGLPWGLWIFEAQLMLYAAGALALRQAIAVRYAAVAPWIFIAIVLNVVALSYTPESLTESLSLSLMLFAAACWVRLRDAGGALWANALLGSLLLGAAVMVRPASLFALFAWCMALAAVCMARRLAWRRALLVAMAAALGTALPMAPQYANNVQHYGERTPLVVAQLATNQQIWGIAYLKYATAMPPVPTPSIFYDNPFAAGRKVDAQHPLRWYVDNPVAGIGTMALHLFNVLDQDLLFTYSRDLDPWYRIPLGVLVHAAVALALIAGGLLLVRRQAQATALTAVAIAAFVLAHAGLHATSAVEMRFGLPLLVLAVPMAVSTLLELRSPESRRLRIPAAVFIVAYVAGALLLSGWVREQAPSIRAWKTAHTALGSGAARPGPRGLARGS